MSTTARPLSDTEVLRLAREYEDMARVQERKFTVYGSIEIMQRADRSQQVAAVCHELIELRARLAELLEEYDA